MNNLESILSKLPLCYDVLKLQKMEGGLMVWRSLIWQVYFIYV